MCLCEGHNHLRQLLQATQVKQIPSTQVTMYKHVRTLTLFHSRYPQRVFMSSKFQSLTLNQTMPLQHIKYDFELAFTKYDIYTYIRTDHKYNIYTDNGTCVCRITTCTYSALVYILHKHLCMYIRICLGQLVAEVCPTAKRYRATLMHVVYTVE